MISIDHFEGRLEMCRKAGAYAVNFDAVGMEAHGTTVTAAIDRGKATAFGKGLTMKMGQTHTQRYMKPLLDRILAGEIDPALVIKMAA